MRDTRVETRDSALEQIEYAVPEICRRRGIEFQLERLNVDAPAICDAQLVATVAGVGRELGLPVKK